mmetsp:Transcript_50509/g.139852  ORF Transcript_50509/g.139852 Transcript_50509/m.139852 type:complete len:294 (+) Transcript_50509:360-1241(+)
MTESLRSYRLPERRGRVDRRRRPLTRDDVNIKRFLPHFRRQQIPSAQRLIAVDGDAIGIEQRRGSDRALWLEVKLVGDASHDAERFRLPVDLPKLEPIAQPKGLNVSGLLVEHRAVVGGGLRVTAEGVQCRASAEQREIVRLAHRDRLLQVDERLRAATHGEQRRAAIDLCEPRIFSERGVTQCFAVVTHGALVVFEGDAHVGAVRVATHIAGRELVDDQRESLLRAAQQHLVDLLCLGVSAPRGQVDRRIEDPLDGLVGQPVGAKGARGSEVGRTGGRAAQNRCTACAVTCC